MVAAADAQTKERLGLISLRERARLVNGIMEIKSKPMDGTRIDVRMPFDAKRITHQLAG